MLNLVFSLWLALVSIFHSQPISHTMVKTAKNVAFPSPRIALTPIPTKELVHQLLSPTVTPLINCVGSDGKLIELSQVDCEKLKEGQKNLPTATPTPQINKANSVTNIVLPTTSQIPTNYVVPTTKQDCSGISGIVASIKDSYQSELNYQITATGENLAARGITPDSQLYQQQMDQALQPIYTQENLQIAQYCLNVTQTTGCSCP